MFDKIKQLTKDTAIYGVSTMVARFLNFILVPFYTNIFPPSEYGIIANIYVFIAILNVVYVFGMDAAYLKFASDKSIDDLKDNFSTPYLSVAAAGLIISAVIILLNQNINRFLDVPEIYFYLLYYAAAILFIDALCVIPFIKLRLEHKAKKFALFKIINIVTNVFFNLLFVLYFRWGIEAILVSNVIASLLTLIILFPDIFINLKRVINFSLLKRLLKFGIPYLPAGLGVMFIQGIDRPILSKMTDLETVGIYNANYKLGIFMMLFVTMFQFAWQPFFLQQAEEKDAKKIFSKVLTYFTFAASLILVVVSLFIEDIAQIKVYGISLIGSEYWSGLGIVPIILFGYLFNGLYVVFSAGIYIEAKSIYVPLITGLGALVNIAANVLLIPPMGIMGAAFATLASYIVMALGLYLVTQKFYKIEYENWKMISVLSFIVFTGIIFYWLRSIDVLNFFYKSIILITFVLIASTIVFDKNELMFLKQKVFNKLTNK